MTNELRNPLAPLRKGLQIMRMASGVGRGSRLSLRLPLAALESAPAHIPLAVANALGSAPARTLKILIVDDNLDAGDSLATRLEPVGHEARLARDRISGLAVAREFDPDVAFLDIGMPGMNGYELARAIRASGKCEDAVLVAMTRWGTKRDMSRLRAAGFDEHFTKPAQVDEVDALLARIAASPPRS